MPQTNAPTAPDPSAPELLAVAGPSAFGGDSKRFWELLWIISVADFRKTYANTALGFAWTIVKPLVFFGLIFLVLREIFRFGANIPNFGEILILGLILYTYFAETTGRAVRSVAAREGMVRKMQFPRIVIPLSVSLAGIFTLILNLAAILPLFVLFGLAPQPEWLMLIPILAVLVIFSTGVGLILSVLYVRFEDVNQVWTLITRVLFYATPVLYPIEILDSPLTEIVSLNPLAFLIEEARIFVIDPSLPQPGDVAGLLCGVIVPVTLIVAAPIVGLYFFNRYAPRMAEAL